MGLVTTYAGDINMESPFSMRWSGVERPLDKLEVGVMFIEKPEQISTGANLVKEMQKNYNGAALSGCFMTSNGDIGFVGLVNHPDRQIKSGFPK